MEDKYQIGLIDQDKILAVVCHGFWTEDVVSQFGADYLRACADKRKAAARLRILCDGRDSQIPESAAARNMQTMIAAVLRHADDRMAVIIGSSLLRMHVKRMYSDPRIDIFDTVDHGRAWLLAA